MWAREPVPSQTILWALTQTPTRGLNSKGPNFCCKSHLHVGASVCSWIHLQIQTRAPGFPNSGAARARQASQTRERPQGVVGTGGREPLSLPHLKSGQLVSSNPLLPGAEVSPGRLKHHAFSREARNLDFYLKPLYF